ncbi:hypothetical protein AMR72_15180 [Flavobacterium psychrophilum]|nr:hypothetical protein AMR72_15180 [Flavobacterium psychrophilum]AOE54438.1 hypothetical protein ALW18_15170 [Flavobacterium psychrophilum]
MANFCSNRVAFEGSKTAIQHIQALFEGMRQKEEQTGKGQLPDFIEREDGYFLDLYCEEGDIGIIQYETRWAPNTEILKIIADHHNIGFVLDYEELGNLVFGRTTYSQGELVDIYLEPEDFDTYELDFDTGIYHFEGQEYEYDCDILETLLERRIQQKDKV